MKEAENIFATYVKERIKSAVLMFMHINDILTEKLKQLLNELQEIRGEIIDVLYKFIK